MPVRRVESPKSPEFRRDDVVLARVTGYPPWPAMIVQGHQVPPAVRDGFAKSKGKDYIVRFIPAADYYFFKGSALTPLDSVAASQFLKSPQSAPSKKLSKGLREGYEIVCGDYKQWAREQDTIVALSQDLDPTPTASDDEEDGTKSTSEEGHDQDDDDSSEEKHNAGEVEEQQEVENEVKRGRDEDVGWGEEEEPPRKEQLRETHAHRASDNASVHTPSSYTTRRRSRPSNLSNDDEADKEAAETEALLSEPPAKRSCTTSNTAKPTIDRASRSSGRASGASGTNGTADVNGTARSGKSAKGTKGRSSRVPNRTKTEPDQSLTEAGFGATGIESDSDRFDREAEEDRKVKMWRFELQRIFLGSDGPLLDSMDRAAHQFSILESTPNITARQIHYSKINKVLKKIIGLKKLLPTTVEKKYRFSERAYRLLRKWQPLLDPKSKGL